MKLLLSALLCVALALLALGWRSGEGLRLIDVSASAATPPPGPEPMDATPLAPRHDPPPPAVTPALAAAPAAPVDPVGSNASPALLLPVQGVDLAQLHDTFTDARGEGRVHDAIDIMAPAGTPVLAVADGHIEKLFDSERGGLTIYQFDPSGRFAYYYAHLERYADGLAEQQRVRRGQVIGHVGSTGNANADAPHLHFAIFVLGPERHWWEGAAINPYPILRGEQPLP